KSSNHCRAVEAAQPHLVRFARNSHNLSVKLQFAVRTTGCQSVVTRDAPANSLRYSADVRRISLRDLRVCLALGLDGSTAQPHHPYPNPNTVVRQNPEGRSYSLNCGPHESLSRL